ncbi:MAG: hypothetical protein F4X17_02170, partial [Gemmatimonadetes bacterium]|nr:hypothetical protein [Gemmatimonadota bacterium]
MLFMVFFFLGVYASAAGSQDFGFVCGFGLDREEGATGQIHDLYLPFYQGGTVRPLILFGKLKSETPDASDPFSLTQLKDRNGNETQSSANLLNPGHKGSLAHYFNEMSYGALTLESNNDGVEGMWFEAKKMKATDYDGTDCRAKSRQFAKDVFADADDTIDFSNYDRDGDDIDGDGVRDPDGVVDLVILYLPKEFRDAGCNFQGTVYTQSGFEHETEDSVTIDGNTVPVTITDNIIYVIQRPSFPYLVGVTAHEYGHVMRLPELYDRQGDPSAGIGLWGVMGLGPVGWSWNLDDDWSQNLANDLYSGPTPLSVWSRYKVGWITEDNGRLVTLESDTEEAATLHDINSQSSTVKAYKIPVRGSDTEYFLMANRQNTYTEHSRGSYYDDSAPASGLAIWHIDDGLPIPSSGLRFDENNNNEKHKRVDLECADGLFSDQGYPSNNRDPVAGGDNLDYASVPVTNNGNLGDATDLWDGSTGPPARTAFTPSSNPSTYGYNDNMTPDDYTDDRQAEFSGIAVRNITQNTTNGVPNGVMSFNIRFIPDAPTVSGNPMQGTGDDWNQVTLSFTAPDVNTAVISGYQYSIDNGTSWNPNPNSNSPWSSAPAPGAGMRTGTISLPTDDNTVEYTFQVRAVTANNEQGEAAAWSSFTLDRPGTVTLSDLTTPKVGDQLTATLTDANGGISGQRWQWERTDDDADEGWTSIGTDMNSYELAEEDVGEQVRARVTYTDSHGPNKSAASDPTASVVDVPPAPDLEAVAGDEQVELTWSAPSSDGGSPILRYHVRYYKADLSDQAAAEWDVVPGGAAAQDTTIEKLTNRTAYVFQVVAENAVGRGVPAEVPATPKAPVCLIAGPTQPTVAENTPTTEAVGTYTITGAGCGAAEWLALQSSDASAFQLQGSGMTRTLHFRNAPDYEAKRSYWITVRIRWGTAGFILPTSVSVSNVEEEGKVTLMGGLPPQEDRAVVAQLTDPDGQITGASWTWQRRSSATAEWEAVSSGASGTSDASGSSVAELSRYTPQAADVGWQVRATVTYTDGHDSNKSQQSDPSAAVIDKPEVPPDLAADPGDRQVALTWSAAEANGSPIQRYHVRYYKADLSDQAEAEWDVVPGGATARDTTIKELTNGTAYVFQVLAENEVGRGVWAEKEATPKVPVCSIAGPTQPTVAENTPTTTAVGTYTITGAGCGAAEWL